MKLLLAVFVLFTVLYAVYDPLQDALEREKYSQLYNLAQNEFFISENARSYFYLGAAYVGLNRPKLANAAFQKVYTYSYELPQGMYIAEYYERIGAFTKAAALYAKNVRLYPDNLESAQRLGKLYFNQKQYLDTIEVCKPILQQDPEKANPLAYYIGASYFQLVDYNNAIGYLDAAYQKGMSDPDLLVKLGYVKINAGDYKNGVDLLAKGLSTSPTEQSTAIYVALGDAYNNLNELELASSAYQKAIERGRAAVNVYIKFATNAFQRKNFQALIDVLEPKAKIFLKNGEYQYYLAAAYDELGDKKNALFYYQRSIEAGYQNKGFVRARMNELSSVQRNENEEQ